MPFFYTFSVFSLLRPFQAVLRLRFQFHDVGSNPLKIQNGWLPFLGVWIWSAKFILKTMFLYILLAASNILQISSMQLQICIRQMHVDDVLSC